jgi:hypothetical protein
MDPVLTVGSLALLLCGDSETTEFGGERLAVVGSCGDEILLGRSPYMFKPGISAGEPPRSDLERLICGLETG